MAAHELKLLNVSVLFYLLAGALIFHSLGEFEPPAPAAGPRRPPGDSSSSASSSSKLQAKDKSQAPDQKQSQSHSQPPASPLSGPKQLGALRLRSVRRMWNITNQLNILYESNWTELVLAELVDFERQLIESLESEQLEGDKSDGITGEHSSKDEGNDDKHDDDDANDDEETKRKKAKQRARELESREQKARQEARLKSLKKALVHSLATMTTMGSPVEPPRSATGKLVTIFYGSLGVPLLVVAVAKSGRSLARSSLNTLLILRHFCFALPFHYLCCTCNLFACLRLLSWCCCCCCCSYLCCLGDHKQKCCDSARAPQLKLASRERKSKRGCKRDDELQTQGADSTSFVIGFQVPGQLDARRAAKQPPEQQKSVRFSSGHAPPEELRENQSDQSLDELKAELAHENETAAFYSHAVFATSLGVLCAYVVAGAYYISRTQDLSLVDALFACYSMLATSSLPDAFELDAGRRRRGREPPSLYQKLTEVDDKVSFESGGNSSSAKPASATITTKAQETASKSHSSETLLIGTIYLLVGLNLISTCVHYAQLWLASVTAKRRSEARREDFSGEKPAKSACNGLASAASHPLIGGSFDRSFHCGSSNQCDPSAISRQLAAKTAGRQQFATSPMGQQQLAADEKQRVDLAELFVMPSGSEHGSGAAGSLVPISNHSDGSFAASEGHSSSTATRSLCAHHQSALTFQTLANSSPYGTNNLQLESAQIDHNGESTVRTSSNVIQIANGGIVAGQPPEMMLPVERSVYNHDTNSLRFKHHQQAHFVRPDGLATLSHSHSANEQDSSPNTFDTTNSQTMSSLSSRAIVLKRPPAETRQEQEPVGNHRGIWFGAGQ